MRTEELSVSLINPLIQRRSFVTSDGTRWFFLDWLNTKPEINQTDSSDQDHLDLPVYQNNDSSCFSIRTEQENGEEQQEGSVQLVPFVRR